MVYCRLQVHGESGEGLASSEIARFPDVNPSCAAPFLVQCSLWMEEILQMKSNRVLALVLVLAMLLSVAPLVGAQGGEFVKTFDIPTTPTTEGPHQ